MDTPENRQEPAAFNPDRQDAVPCAPEPPKGAAAKLAAFFRMLLCEPSPIMDSVEDRRRDRQYILPCIIGLLGLMAGMAFFYFFAIVMKIGEDLSTIGKVILGLLPYQFFTFGACVLGLIPLMRREGLAKAFDILSPMPPLKSLIASVLKLLVLMYPLVFVLNHISEWICTTLSIPFSEQMIPMLGKDAGLSFWVFSAICSVVFAPVTEEVMIRLVLFRAIRGLIPVWATILSTLAFTLMHGGTPQYWPSLFLIGLFLIRARRVMGLQCSILLHSTYNLIAFVFILLQLFFE